MTKVEKNYFNRTIYLLCKNCFDPQKPLDCYNCKNFTYSQYFYDRAINDERIHLNYNFYEVFRIYGITI